MRRDKPFSLNELHQIPRAPVGSGGNHNSARVYEGRNMLKPARDKSARCVPWWEEGGGGRACYRWDSGSEIRLLYRRREEKKGL